MDTIFGKKHFRNEIVWRIGWVSGFKTQKKGWIRNHDILLYYVKSMKSIRHFNKEYLPYPEDYVRRDGKPGAGKGFPIEDTWNCSEKDILNSIGIMSFAKKTGYPTEKPVDLLNRIIKASSNKGDVVLDPFCGCGTSIESAMKLERRFIGIDISAFAIDLIKEQRLQETSIRTEGIPTDMYSAEKLSKDNAFNFESWAITRIPGFVPNTRQIADGGIDGRAKLEKQPEGYDSKLALAQVKGGEFNLSQLRDFIGVIHREKSALGCYITLKNEYTRNARVEAKKMGMVKVGNYCYPRLSLWSIEEHFDGKPIDLPNMMDPYLGKPLQQKLV